MILEFIKDNKKKLLIILIIIIVLCIVMFFINKSNKSKIYSSESYVYTKETYDSKFGLISKLPYINVKSDDVNNINISLINKFYEIIAIDDYFMNYEFYKTDNILSLIVNIHSNISPDSYPKEVLIYNIDIDTGKIISDDQLFYIFNVSDNEVQKNIESGIKDYYNYEISKEYHDASYCDFDCYLSGSNALPILDNCSYYVKQNTLYAYKIIDLNSNFFYDVNSGFNLFNFKIKEK